MDRQEDYQQALEAIRRLFSNTSRTPNDTWYLLEDLVDEIRVLQESLPDGNRPAN